MEKDFSLFWLLIYSYRNGLIDRKEFAMGKCPDINEG